MWLCWLIGLFSHQCMVVDTWTTRSCLPRHQNYRWHAHPTSLGAHYNLCFWPTLIGFQCCHSHFIQELTLPTFQHTRSRPYPFTHVWPFQMTDMWKSETWAVEVSAMSISINQRYPVCVWCIGCSIGRYCHMMAMSTIVCWIDEKGIQSVLV